MAAIYRGVFNQMSASAIWVHDISVIQPFDLSKEKAP
jgi:hypothetical protein